MTSAAESLFTRLLLSPAFVFKPLRLGESEPSADAKLHSLRVTFDKDPAIFLSRWGRFLGAEDLGLFDQWKDDYEVRHYLTSLQNALRPAAPAALPPAAPNPTSSPTSTLTPTNETTTTHFPPSSKRAANRRLAYLPRLHRSDYFSDDAMRGRDPVAYHEFVGRWKEAEERKPFGDDMTLLDRVLHNIDAAYYHDALDAARARESQSQSQSHPQSPSDADADDESVPAVPESTDADADADEDSGSGGGGMGAPGLAWATGARSGFLRQQEDEEEFVEEFEEEDEDVDLGTVASAEAEQAGQGGGLGRSAGARPTVPQRGPSLAARGAPTVRARVRGGRRDVGGLRGASAAAAAAPNSHPSPPIPPQEHDFPSNLPGATYPYPSATPDTPNTPDEDLLDELDESSGLDATLDDLRERELAMRVGRKDLVRVMEERFLGGRDSDFDYAAVDTDSDLDDLTLLERDVQERYFDEDEDEDLGSDGDGDGDDEEDGGEGARGGRGVKGRAKTGGRAWREARSVRTGSQYDGRVDY
ncbi:hypothetical protein M427DRAFT_68222 [Gonapodya prolifera JEL478]|uniref:CCD97-like C-terminal domain-containing protein n=1 Tax=Gonapodya prolifera (strain JEL478) TaxID=1344416 RepID=A0A139AMF0_GONPJ|nr:hypothetical protein M427DRAFT_68222 [Gonapodya prolifera JEL478]|eukprot:KXS17703.1 hypothetical protein M427DRAFT_68222 [Gonapodya prolifera JEL478]